MEGLICIIYIFFVNGPRETHAGLTAAPNKRKTTVSWLSPFPKLYVFMSFFRTLDVA